MAERSIQRRKVLRWALTWGVGLGAIGGLTGAGVYGAGRELRDSAGTRIPVRERRIPPPSYPRPTKGILVAITVMNWTLASGGSVAM